MIRVKNNAALQKEAAAAAQRLREERAERKAWEEALPGWRKFALWVSRRWWFSQLSLFLIIAFSIMLALQDPLDPDNETAGNKFIAQMEQVFTVIFTVEVVVVWAAEGLCEFFKEPWNFLDWIIVALGWLSMTSLGANFGALRTIRLLRPLRTLKRIESMRKLINSLLSALPGLVNVGGMMFAFVFVMSLFGVKMFKGTMRFHCVPEDDYDGAVERALMYADRECEYLADPIHTNPQWGALAWGVRCGDLDGDEDACAELEYCNWLGGEEERCEEKNELLVGGDRVCNAGTGADAINQIEYPIREVWEGACDAAVDKADCGLAGKCSWDNATSTCSAETVTVKYVNMSVLDLSKQVDYFGVPARQLWTNLTEFGDEEPFGKYAKVCYGYMLPDEMGYDTTCDPAGTCLQYQTVYKESGKEAAAEYLANDAAECCKWQPRHCPCQCMDGYICDDTGGPNYGFSTFDHMGLALLSIFQIITLEGWTELLDGLTDMNWNVLVIIFFCVVVWMGAFFLTHYLLAMICLEFTKKLKGTQMAAAALDAEKKFDAKLGEDAVQVQVTPAEGGQLWCFSGEHLMTRTEYKFKAFQLTEHGFQVTTKDQTTEFQCAQADEVCELIEIELKKSTAPWGAMWRWVKAKLKTDPLKAKAKRDAQIAKELANGPSIVKRLRTQIVKFCTHTVFENFINFIIIVNFFMLAYDHHGMPYDQVKAFEDINFVLTMIFVGEMVLKMFGFGLKDYFRDKFNCFDAFIVSTSIVELAMATEPGDGGSFSVLRTLRLLRILRSFKLVKGMDTLKKMMATTAGSMAAIANFAVLLLLLLYIFALVGMQMFGGGLVIEGETARPHFDNLIWSFVSVFLVMTRENWQALLYDTMHATQPAALLYYYVLIITTNYVLLALFVGTLLENFEKFFLSGAYEKKVQKEKTQRLGAKKFLRKFKMGKGKPLEEEDVADVAAIWKNKLKKPGAGGAKPGGAGGALAAFGAAKPAGGDKPKGAGALAAFGSPAAKASKYDAPDEPRARVTSTDKPPEPLNLLPEVPAKKKPTDCLSVMKRCRAKSRNIVEHSVFENMVIFAIVVSSSCLAIEHPLDDKYSVKHKVLVVLDLFFIVFFTFEMVAKILSLGLIRGKEAYLRSGWNVLDGFIVVTANIVLVTGAEGGFFRVIRTVRVLRPLRAIQRSKGMRQVAGGLFKAVPSIMTVGALVFFFMVVSSIFCVQMFKGTMWYCTNPDCGNAADGQYCAMDECLGTFVDAESGEMSESEWANGDWNFDALGPALLALFEIFALEAWPDILLALVDASDVNHGPKENAQVGAVWLFVVMIMLGAFFLLNLFVGVIVTAYNEVQADDTEEDKDEEAETAARHEEMWTKDLVELVGMAETKKLVYLDYKYRGPFMRITSARWFEPVVMLIIVLNVCVMGVDTVDYDTGQTPEDLRNVVEYINIFFTFSFAGEMVIKLISYTPKGYFIGEATAANGAQKTFCSRLQAWNIFDFIITNVSLVELLLPLPLNPTLVRIFRIFRLARLLRLSKKAKGLKTLMKTFSATLPSLGHVGFLLMIFFFMYAVLGTQLWWNLKRGELVNDYNNFSNFGNSLYALFRLSTGENWNGIMHEGMLQPPDCHMGYCSIGGTERVCLAGTTGEFCELTCSESSPDCLEPGDGLWDNRWVPPQDHPQTVRLDESCAAMGGVSDRATPDGEVIRGEGWEWTGRGASEGFADAPASWAGAHVASAWEKREDIVLTDDAGDWMLGMVHPDCGTGASSFYHITFTIICAFTTLNLIIAVILFAFFDFSESAKRPTLEGDKVQKFEDSWANFDKNADGELPCSFLPKLILANGPPLGVKKFADAEEREQDLWETGILLDRNGKIQFKELLHAMVMVAFGLNVAAIEEQKRLERRSKKVAALEGNEVAATPMLRPDSPGSPSYRDGSADGEGDGLKAKGGGGGRTIQTEGGSVAKDLRVSVMSVDDDPLSPLSPSPEKPVTLSEAHPLSPVTPMPGAEGEGAEAGGGGADRESEDLLPPPVALPATELAQPIGEGGEAPGAVSEPAPQP